MRRRRGILGRVDARDLIMLGLAGAAVWAVTRKPVEVKTTVDWTSQAKKDFLDIRAILKRG